MNFNRERYSVVLAPELVVLLRTGKYFKIMIDPCVCAFVIAVVHDSHRIHLQPMDEERNQMRCQWSTGVEHGDGLVRVRKRGTS